MIGLDVARIKRWFVKTYPQYSGIGFFVEVRQIDNMNGDNYVDHKGGFDGTFRVDVFDTDGVLIYWSTGEYSRMHYGGWKASETSHYVPAG